MECAAWLAGCMSLWCLLRGLAALLPDAPHSGSTRQDSGWNEKELGLLCGVPHSGGSWALTQMFLLSLVGEVTGWEGLSWQWAVPLWGRGDVGKVKLFLLPYSMHQISYVFWSGYVLEPLLWTPRLPQGHSSSWVIKSVLLERKMVENYQFHHVDGVAFSAIISEHLHARYYSRPWSCCGVR